MSWLIHFRHQIRLQINLSLWVPPLKNVRLLNLTIRQITLLESFVGWMTLKFIYSRRKLISQIKTLRFIGLPFFFKGNCLHFILTFRKRWVYSLFYLLGVDVYIFGQCYRLLRSLLVDLRIRLVFKSTFTCFMPTWIEEWFIFPILMIVTVVIDPGTSWSSRFIALFMV